MKIACHVPYAILHLGSDLSVNSGMEWNQRVPVGLEKRKPRNWGVKLSCNGEGVEYENAALTYFVSDVGHVNRSIS